MIERLPSLTEALVFDCRGPEDVANVIASLIEDDLDLLDYLVRDGGAPTTVRAWRERNASELPPELAELVMGVSLPLLLKVLRQRCLDKAGVVTGDGWKARQPWAGRALTLEEFKEVVEAKKRREVERYATLIDTTTTREVREVEHVMDNDANGWLPREIRHFSGNKLGERPRDLTGQDVAIGRVGEGIDRKRK